MPPSTKQTAASIKNLYLSLQVSPLGFSIKLSLGVELILNIIYYVVNSHLRKLVYDVAFAIND